jgi:ribosomal protein S27E
MEPPDEDGPVGTVLPHSEFGDIYCCGYLAAIVHSKLTNLTCNECGVTVRTVPTIELAKTLDEMELTLDVAIELCPYCRQVNLFPGLTHVLAFTCRQCGKAVES